MRQADPNQKLKLLGRCLHGLGLLAALVTVLLVQFVIFRPIDHRTAACRQRSEKLQALLQQAPKIRREHAQLEKDLALARGQSATLQKRIPDDPREADFLAQVSRLAGEVGLQIRDYRPAAVETKPSYSVMRVDLACQGDYASICNFLGGLCELPRHSTVLHLQIDSDGDRQEYSVKLSLALYFAATGQSGVERGKKNDA